MRSVKVILAVMLFALEAKAQENLPVIKSNVSVITIQDGAELKKNFWTLADLYPQIIEWFEKNN